MKQHKYNFFEDEIEIKWSWIIRQPEFYIPAIISLTMFFGGIIGLIIIEFLYE